MQSLPDFAFLHGGGQGGWTWEPTVAALALQAGGKARTLALDVPGCGTKRGRDTSALGPDAIAEELLADLDAAGFGETLLVGHSQAGGILPRMAARDPERFRRLVYVSCSIPLEGQTVLEMMGKGPHGSDPDAVGWPAGAEGDPRTRYPQMFCNDMTVQAATGFLAALGKDSWPARSYTETHWPAAPVQVPASYVLCLRDGILPVAWQERFAARFGCGQVVCVDAGHQVMNSRPHALAEILLLEAARF